MPETEGIHFSETSLQVLNVALGFIMFGIALGIQRQDFLSLKKSPLALVAGIVAQFFILPLFTFGLIMMLQPPSGIAYGMILVAACPGGTISNFICLLSKGNVALSVALTSVATLLAVVFTPLNYAWYAAWYGESTQTTVFALQFSDVVKSIFILIVVPMSIGFILKNKFPVAIQKITLPVQRISLGILVLFIVLAFKANYKVFLLHFHTIFFLILIHNLLAFISGFLTAKLFQLKKADTKTITIETGIQNSGLGLILIFNYFNGNAEMALITAWWGVWHIISGFLLSLGFKRW